MSQTVGAHILERLHGHGIRRVYGYPGDGINGILGGFHVHGEEIEFIQAAHEELAALMACADAKLGGDVGVCLATSGPGAIHLLNGLYDAKLDHQPVVAIVGQQSRISLGSSYQQEVDLVSLFKDVASDFVQVATVPAQVTHLIDRAVQIARGTRSVTCVTCRPTSRRRRRSRPRAPTAPSSPAGRCTSRGCCRSRTTSSAPPRCSTPASASRS